MSAVYLAFGVLLGGAVALASELILDRRRSRREDVAYDRVTRAARRLVANELDTNRGHLELMLKRGMWPVPDFVERARFLPTAEWEERKGRLAEALDDENTWIVVAAFYYSVGQLRARALGEKQGSPLADKERESLQSMHDQAMVLGRVLSENAPLPDNWRDHLDAMREAGRL